MNGRCPGNLFPGGGLGWWGAKCMDSVVGQPKPKPARRRRRRERLVLPARGGPPTGCWRVPAEPDIAAEENEIACERGRHPRHRGAPPPSAWCPPPSRSRYGCALPPKPLVAPTASSLIISAVTARGALPPPCLHPSYQRPPEESSLAVRARKGRVNNFLRHCLTG